LLKKGYHEPYAVRGITVLGNFLVRILEGRSKLIISLSGSY